MQVEINYWGVPLIVQGTYYEGDSQVMYDSNGGGYPGSPSEFEILEITVSDSEIDILVILSIKQIDEITDLVIEKIEE
jgi:hypothetical protein